MARCDKGKIVLQNGNLEILQVFNKTSLSVPISSIVGFVIASGLGSAHKVSIHTTTGVHELAMVSGFNDITRQLPNVPIEDPARVPWYASQFLRAYVGVYTKPKDMQSDLAQAALNGWQVQGQSAVAGSRSVGAMVAGDLIAGPLGALAMSGKSKDKTTLTFVRTPEWLAAHPLPK